MNRSDLAPRKHDDMRIKSVTPLESPEYFISSIPLSPSRRDVIAKGRLECENIVKGLDDRLLVIVGPCSIHDTSAALDYARRLKRYADTCRDDLCLVMRVYFEKPRTTIGWKGLVSDPDLDNTTDVNKGIKISRSLLGDVVDLGLYVGCEFLNTILCQYFVDLVAWAAIGARTAESQNHREMVSGLSVSIGFKNSTNGDLRSAFDAIVCASAPHSYVSISRQGMASVVSSLGNECCHAVLRGGDSGTNYDEDSVIRAIELANRAQVNPRVMIDCSHGNSGKDHRKQESVVGDICRQLQYSKNSEYIMGVMIESNINEGKQDINVHTSRVGQALKYGVSVTDACVSWDETVRLLDNLRYAVKARRKERLSQAE